MSRNVCPSATDGKHVATIEAVRVTGKLVTFPRNDWDILVEVLVEVSCALCGKFGILCRFDANPKETEWNVK